MSMEGINNGWQTNNYRKEMMTMEGINNERESNN